MRAVVFLVQLVFWLLVARLVLRGIAGLFRGAPAPERRQAPRPQPSRQIEDLVPCALCRTHAPRSSMLGARVGAREERFCSAGCRDKALAAVARAS